MKHIFYSFLILFWCIDNFSCYFLSDINEQLSPIHHDPTVKVDHQFGFFNQNAEDGSRGLKNRRNRQWKLNNKEAKPSQLSMAIDEMVSSGGFRANAKLAARIARRFRNQFKRK